MSIKHRNSSFLYIFYKIPIISVDIPNIHEIPCLKKLFLKIVFLKLVFPIIKNHNFFGKQFKTQTQF